MAEKREEGRKRGKGEGGSDWAVDVVGGRSENEPELNQPRLLVNSHYTSTFASLFLVCLGMPKYYCDVSSA